MSPASVLPDVTELVRALALAWKNLAAYPAGHPALSASLGLAHQRLHELRGPAAQVVFGVAADGLVYGSEKIDSVPAQKFAHALYTNGVAVLRFEEGVTAPDIESFLRLLGVGSVGEPRGALWDEMTAAGVATIRIQPVDYSAVQVTDHLDSPPPKPESTSLWDEILRALMAGRNLSASGQQITSRGLRTVDELSSIIVELVNDAERDHNAEFDPNATFGVKLTARTPNRAGAVIPRVTDAIGLYIAGSSGLKKQLAVQHVAQLLNSLPEPMRGAVLRTVLRTLATDDASGSLLREFETSLPRNEVLEGLRHLANVAKLSKHAMTLLQAYVNVETPSPHKAAAPSAPAALLDELLELFGEDDIDRFNPDDHRALLEQVSIEMPKISSRILPVDGLGDRVETIADEAVQSQVVSTLLDLLSAHGDATGSATLFARVESLFRQQLGNGLFAGALATIQRLQEMATREDRAALRDAAGASLGRLVDPEGIHALIETVMKTAPEQIAPLKRLIETMGAAATRSLLVSLAEENNRSRRRRLFDFVISLGPTIVPEVTTFLDDPRWYVVRNMIVLLRGVNDRTALPDIHRCARHPDMRVRLEAIKALFALEPSVPRALLEKAIHDPDPKLAETAIALVGSYGIREGVDPLLQILDGRDVLARRTMLRVRVIRALGELGEASALPRLSRFFTDSRLPWPTPDERRAAYESLATYPAEARSPFVEKGIKSRDPKIRAICRRLLAR